MNRTCLSCLILLAAGCSPKFLPSSREQTTKVENKVLDTISEVGEMRNAVTTQIRNVQDSAFPWMIALLGVALIAAALPVVALALVAWLVRKWIGRYSYMGQFKEIVAAKAHPPK